MNRRKSRKLQSFHLPLSGDCGFIHYWIDGLRISLHLNVVQVTCYRSDLHSASLKVLAVSVVTDTHCSLTEA